MTKSNNYQTVKQHLLLRDATRLDWGGSVVYRGHVVGSSIPVQLTGYVLHEIRSKKGVRQIETAYAVYDLV